jgi:triacylglycerol lipase
MINPLPHLSMPKAQRIHTTALAAEALVIGGLVIWFFVAGKPLRAAMLACLPLAYRAAYAGALTIIARVLFRTPGATPLLSLAWFRLIARGAIAILRNQIAMAFPPRIPMFPAKSSAGTAIVALIHGYSCNAGCFGRLPKGLARCGVECVAIELTDPTGDLEVAATEATAWLVEVRRQSPSRPIVLVGISMGGLVARLALARVDAPRIDHLVTISSPHGGTWTAYLGLGAAARGMRPQSPMIQKLAAFRAPCEATALWTPDDTIILPPESGQLKDAAQIAVPGYTHLAVANAPEVTAAISRAADSAARNGKRRSDAAISV